MFRDRHPGQPVFASRGRRRDAHPLVVFVIGVVDRLDARGSDAETIAPVPGRGEAALACREVAVRPGRRRGWMPKHEPLRSALKDALCTCNLPIAYPGATIRSALRGAKVKFKGGGAVAFAE